MLLTSRVCRLKGVGGLGALLSDEAPGGHTAAWEGGDLHKRAEARSSVTLWQDPFVTL